MGVRVSKCSEQKRWEKEEKGKGKRREERRERREVWEMRSGRGQGWILGPCRSGIGPQIGNV